MVQDTRGIDPPSDHSWHVGNASSAFPQIIPRSRDTVQNDLGIDPPSDYSYHPKASSTSNTNNQKYAVPPTIHSTSTSSDVEGLPMHHLAMVLKEEEEQSEDEEEKGDVRAVVLYEPTTTTDTSNTASSRELTASQPKTPKHSTIQDGPVGSLSQALVVSQPKTKHEMRHGFDHCFLTVPCKDRLSVLFATLRRNSERKVIVICSTWESAAFHTVLFQQLEMLHVSEMHEQMNMKDVHNKFSYAYPGILFSSEISLREFDIPPNVDYVIQYEPPMDPTEYIYRMSNARLHRTSCRKALIFLTDEEKGFLKYFDSIDNEELEARKVSEFQERVEKLVSKHSELNDMARKALKSFVVSYESHSYKNVYDHAKLDQDKIRISFGQPDSSKYAAHKNESKGEKKEANAEERESDVQKAGSNQWSTKEKTWRKGDTTWSKKEKTWRKAGNLWTTREEKTWKYGHRPT